MNSFQQKGLSHPVWAKRLFYHMNYKTIGYFLLSTLIIGSLYTNGWFNISYTFRQLIGIIFIIAYFAGTVFFIRAPILRDKQLKRHFLIRLGILILIGLIIIISQWYLHKENDRLGAGYLFYFEMLGFGIPLLIYTVIESIWLLAKKKYAALCINLLLAMGIYCIVIFSGLFGF